MTSPRTSPNARLRRFRVDVGALIAVVVLVEALLLVVLGYWGSQRLISALGHSAQRSIHAHIQDKVEGLLGRAASVVQALGDSPSLSPTGPHAARSAEQLWALLGQTPEIDSLYLADLDGRMLMVQRYPELAVRHIVAKPRGTIERYEFKPPPGASGGGLQRFATLRIEERHTHYNPTQRGWFQSALHAGKPVWSAPYIFSAAQELGVTYSLPSPWQGPGGAMQTRVVAGDVTLGRLSEFVRLFSRSGYGDSTLLSADGAVLARSDQPGKITALRRAADSGGMLGALFDGSHAMPDNVTFTLDHAGERFLVQSSHIPQTGWQLVSWVAERQVLGGLRTAVMWSLGAVALFLLVVMAVSLRVARLVTRPVERLSLIARDIGRLKLDNLPRVTSRVLEIQHLDQALDDSARSLLAFRKFVPIDVVNQLVRQGQALSPGGAARRITVMFTDIEGFTRISEDIEPAVLVNQLTEYFNLAASVISHHGGIIDKFIGDGIMVLWGAPAELDDAPFHACTAALELQARADALNRQWRARGLEAFETRIGIHTGVAVTGVLGSNDRLAYTAFGDTVNVASRIEGINRDLGTRVLISQATFDELNGRLATRRIEQVALRGRQTRVALYELTEPESTEPTDVTPGLNEKGL